MCPTSANNPRKGRGFRPKWCFLTPQRERSGQQRKKEAIVHPDSHAFNCRQLSGMRGWQLQLRKFILSQASYAILVFYLIGSVPAGGAHIYGVQLLPPWSAHDFRVFDDGAQVAPIAGPKRSLRHPATFIFHQTLKASFKGVVGDTKRGKSWLPSYSVDTRLKGRVGTSGDTRVGGIDRKAHSRTPTVGRLRRNPQICLRYGYTTNNTATDDARTS